MQWFISLIPLRDETICVMQSDLKEKNIFSFISDDQEGIDWIDSLIKNIISSNQKIIFTLDKLATLFVKDKKKSIWQYLIETYGFDKYDLVENEKNNFVVYWPKKDIDISSCSRQPCSIRLLEKYAPEAFYSYIHKKEPPFSPLEVAYFTCLMFSKVGLCRLFSSLGVPPSSKDIEKILRPPKKLRKELKNVDFHSSVITDIVYIIHGTSATSLDYDREEFYLCYVETASKYKKYGINLSHKLAVLETCQKYNLRLACSSLYSEDKKTSKGYILLEEEDYVLPLDYKKI